MADIEKFYPKNGLRYRIIDPDTNRHVDEERGVVVTDSTRIFYTRLERNSAGVIRNQLSELEKPETGSDRDNFKVPKLKPYQNLTDVTNKNGGSD